MNIPSQPLSERASEGVGCLFPNRGVMFSVLMACFGAVLGVLGCFVPPASEAFHAADAEAEISSRGAGLSRFTRHNIKQPRNGSAASPLSPSRCSATTPSHPAKRRQPELPHNTTARSSHTRAFGRADSAARRASSALPQPLKWSGKSLVLDVILEHPF